MALQNISDDSKELIISMIDVLEKDKKVGPREENDLEKLKEKRRELAYNFNKIENGYLEHHIDQVTYNKAKEKFEFDKSELDLEILSRKSDMMSRKSYLKRIKLLKLIMKLKDNSILKINGKVFTKNDLYVEFLKTIATESIEKLHNDQNLIRLKMEYNKDENAVDKNHRFYASEKSRQELREELVNLYDEIKEVDNTIINPNDVDFDSLTAMDFINPDSKSVYDKLFKNSSKQK